jgi:hypothetical protein
MFLPLQDPIGSSLFHERVTGMEGGQIVRKKAPSRFELL